MKDIYCSNDIAIEFLSSPDEVYYCQGMSIGMMTIVYWRKQENKKGDIQYITESREYIFSICKP